MKQTSRILLFFFIFTLLSCENENFRQDEYSKKESLSISNAKKWFTKFETTENVDPLFQDLVYDWENAHESTLNDGSKAITVPIFNQNRYIDYSSKQVLYLYSKNDSNEFTATLIDLLTPNKASQDTKRAMNKLGKEDLFDLETFGGYIIKWDLVKGFIKGAKFSNGIAVSNIDLAIMSSNTIENLFDRNQSSKKKEEKLNEVIVFTYKKGGYMILRESKDQRTDHGGSAGGYIGDPRTGGGGGASTTAVAAEEIEDIINDANLTPCLKAILEQLKNTTNSDIASILKKLGATNVYNVTIKMGEMKFPTSFAET